MCGIVGILNLNQDPVSQEILDKLTDTLSHRGPDGRGTYISKNLGFGHRRLSVIDITDAGSQPMESRNGSNVISYNGEIYNYREIREELIKKGYIFKSNCDTEVVLNSWIEWGKESVKKFNGMFAFAIWDNNKKSLYLARDRYGIKPIYYAKINNIFIFASEQKAIIHHPSFEKKLNKSSLLEYFTFQNIFTDKTLLEGIQILQPGTIAEISMENQNLKLKNYWDFNFNEDNENVSFDEYKEELIYLLKQAVKRQLVSDVEIGAYLSGGMDSGTITALASKDVTNLKSFTCGFDLSSASGIELMFDERKNAEFMSAKFKTEHYQIVLKSGDMERSLNKLINHIEEPRIGQSYPNFYASKLASKFVKVVLSGIGSDELFAGYIWRYNKVKNAKNYSDFIDKSYSLWQRLLSETEKKSVFSPIWNDVKDINTKCIFANAFKGSNTQLSNNDSFLNQTLYFENKTFLQGLLIIEDKISMSHGLETRVPFLDNDLVDFAMRCPTKFKLNSDADSISLDENDSIRKTQTIKEGNSSGKKILRESMSKIIPKEILSLRKQGFSSPDSSWFKGESMDFVKDLLLSRNALIYQYMDKKSVLDLLDSHFKGKENKRLLIWSLLNIETWLTQMKL